MSELNIEVSNIENQIEEFSRVLNSIKELENKLSNLEKKFSDLYLLYAESIKINCVNASQVETLINIVKKETEESQKTFNKIIIEEQKNIPGISLSGEIKPMNIKEFFKNKWLNNEEFKCLNENNESYKSNYRTVLGLNRIKMMKQEEKFINDISLKSTQEEKDIYEANYVYTILKKEHDEHNKNGNYVRSFKAYKIIEREHKEYCSFNKIENEVSKNFNF